MKSVNTCDWHISPILGLTIVVTIFYTVIIKRQEILRAKQWILELLQWGTAIS